ncbi:MAG: helix-turn-helix domain-containing protein [Gemmataceae bacterium]
MAIVEVPLSAVGLLTLAEVAERLECSLSAVQKWAAAGLLPVVVAGSGSRRTYLVREKDLKGFTRPTMGRPRIEG